MTEPFRRVVIAFSASVPLMGGRYRRVATNVCRARTASLWDLQAARRLCFYSTSSNCVRGMCGGCGKVVHAEAARAMLGGVYWHMDCAQRH